MELATTISYPTSTSGIIVLLKIPKEIHKIGYKKRKGGYNYREKDVHAYHISGQWYMCSYTIMRQPIKIEDLQ